MKKENLEKQDESKNENEVKTKKKKMTVSKLLCIIIVLVGITIVLLIAWSKFQTAMFFYPWEDRLSHRQLTKIDEFEEINIKNDEVDLSGWFWNIQDSDEESPLVIFFTGNAQNSSNTLYNYYSEGIMKDVFESYNLMIIDYPGYGLSEGEPSDESMFLASDYVFEYAVSMPKVNEDNIVILGYSIGTGVATYCASQNNASALILIAPYDEGTSLYNDYIDSFHGSMTSLVKYKFDSSKYAEDVIEPTLIITSKSDEVINYEHSLDLAGHFPELDDVVILEGVDHNGYFSQSEVLSGITEFLNKSLK